MIQKIIVENCFSFKDKQTFNFSKEENIFGIIGHNSSGKSNFIKLFDAIKFFIINSFNIPPHNLLQLNKNKFKDDNISYIELEFIIKNKKYNYSIYSSYFINNEKLLIDDELIFEYSQRIKEDKEEEFFEKIKSNINIPFNLPIEYKFEKSNDELTKFLEFKKPNASFISTVKNLNGKYFDEIYNYFLNLNIKNSFNGNIGALLHNGVFAKLLNDKNNKEELLNLIKFVDKDISDYTIETKEVPQNRISIKLDGITNNLETTNEQVQETIDELLFIKNGQSFNIMEISQGTIKLLELLPDIFKLKKSGGILIVDEIEIGLNPKIYGTLLDIIKNIPNIQFIFTTHNLLFLDYLKSNQIYVFDNIDNNSIGTIVEEFYNKDNSYHNFLRDYLLGKYDLEKKSVGEIELDWID